MAVTESQCEARTATPDALDSPPAMPDSRFVFTSHVVGLQFPFNYFTYGVAERAVWGPPVLW